MQSGKLSERVKLLTRIEVNPDLPNDYGNTVAEWVEQGEVAAEFIHLRGTESVMASRLQGRHVQVIRVRASSLTRQISTDWRVTDARRGTEFNVRDVTPLVDRSGYDLLCESGVA